jgi:hypothetical protein
MQGMQVLWRESGQLYDRFVSVIEVTPKVARISYEVYRARTAEMVESVMVEAANVDRACEMLASIVTDPAYRGWVGHNT